MAFESSADDLDPADGDSEFDVYVKDLITGDLTLVSTSTAGTKGNDDSFFSDSSAAEDPHVEPFSRDGTAVAFMSNATNLDSDDTDSTLDIYVKDLASGVLTLASTSDAGVKANGANESPSLTFDGTKVTFTSLATNLDCLDPHPLHDVYVKDLLTGDITLLSITASGQKGNGVSMDPAISSDGSSVAFRSDSTNLHPSDPDGSTDIYVKEPKPTSCPGAAADLSIVKSDSPDPATVGHPLVYNLDVDNAGPGEAGTVVVTDGLPPSVTFGSASASQGTCSQSAGTVTCDLGSIASGESATVTIQVTPNQEGTITDTGSVSSITDDPDPQNNSDSEDTTVVAERGTVRITKTVRGGPLSATDSFRFEVRRGASTTSAGTVLESRDATLSNGGSFTFTNQLEAGESTSCVSSSCRGGRLTCRARS